MDRRESTEHLRDCLELVCTRASFFLVTTRKMRVGPAESAYRSRHQTTLSCCG